MRQIREVLRLKWACGLSDRRIAQRLRISRPTVAQSLQRAKIAGLSGPLPEGLEEQALEQRLFATAYKTPPAKRPLPDWATVHHERKRKGVPRLLLWQAYKAATPDGLQYRSFCEAYRQWVGRLDLVMRQPHRAGETLFVDDAGQTMEVITPQTGAVHDASIFIAVLGASNSPFVEAPWSQHLKDWIASPVRTFEALGGVPQVVVPDQLKAAVNRAQRDAPDLHRTSADMAQHSGVAVVPARAARPRDNAKGEVAVQVVERWMLARRRNRTFFSLAELNRAIKDLRVERNHRPCKKLPGSRHSLCESLDRPALRPLPENPEAYAEWKLGRGNIDDHVEIDGHYYSVPYALVKHQLDARLPTRTVELFHTGKRIASHPRAPHKGRHTPVTAHMPQAHQNQAQWPPQRLIRWAEKTGGATAQVVEALLASRPPPHQGFRSCVGRMRLGKRYGDHRLEAACHRARYIGACSYKSIAAILTHALDRQPVPGQTKTALCDVQHDNVRGPNSYP